MERTTPVDRAAAIYVHRLAHGDKRKAVEWLHTLNPNLKVKKPWRWICYWVEREKVTPGHVDDVRPGGRPCKLGDTEAGKAAEAFMDLVGEEFNQRHFFDYKEVS